MQPSIRNDELKLVFKVFLNESSIWLGSSTSMRLIRRWVYCPHELNKEDHIDVLYTIGEAIANRE
eukprot:460118-Prorocentrum_minimum.AAC.1